VRQSAARDTLCAAIRDAAGTTGALIAHLGLLSDAAEAAGLDKGVIHRLPNWITDLGALGAFLAELYEDTRTARERSG
jgi:hypothetical protein